MPPEQVVRRPAPSMRIVSDPPVLALFAERVPPEPRPLPKAETEVLRTLLLLRRQLLPVLVAEKNRALVAAPTVRKSLTKYIRWLERELIAVEDDLAAAIRINLVWRAKENLLRSVPGVGRVLAPTLLPELGRLNRRGLLVGGGRASLRPVLPSRCCGSTPRAGERSRARHRPAARRAPRGKYLGL